MKIGFAVSVYSHRNASSYIMASSGQQSLNFSNGWISTVLFNGFANHGGRYSRGSGNRSLWFTELFLLGDYYV